MPHTSAFSFLSLGLLASTALSLSTADSSKRGFSLPARRVKSLNRRANGGSSSATDNVVIDFTFGGQRIPVSMDTGSSFTYVASTLDNDESDVESLPTLFNPNASSNFQVENDPDDTFDCDTYQSTVCFLGTDDVSAAGLTAQNMVFGVATKLPSETFSSGQAGTVGMGRQGGAPGNWLPRDQVFWYRVGADLPSPYLFTVDIYQDRNGSWDFGYIDESKHSGDITYGKMDVSMTQWNFNMTGFAIGSNSMQSLTEFTGIVDTGGPNIGLPKDIGDAYFQSIGGSEAAGNGYTYPCSAYPPPALTLQLASGGTLVLNGSFLVTPPEDGMSSEDTCNGRIDNSVQTQYNIGACMLDQKFVVFDPSNERIGFADKAGDGSSSFPPPSSTSGTSTAGSSSGSGTPSSTPTKPSKTSSSSTTSPTNAAPRSSLNNAGSLSSLFALILAIFALCV